MSELGQRLKWLRYKKNISQAELAKMINMDRGSYAKLEYREDLPVTLDKFIRMADVFEVSLDYLVGRTGDKFKDREYIEFVLVNKSDRILEIVKLYCNEKKITLNEFSKLSGVDRTTVYKIENGNEPGIRTLRKLAAVMGYGLEEFMRECGYFE